jgi:hypothetical protein
LLYARNKSSSKVIGMRFTVFPQDAGFLVNALLQSPLSNRCLPNAGGCLCWARVLCNELRSIIFAIFPSGSGAASPLSACIQNTLYNIQLPQLMQLIYKGLPSIQLLMNFFGTRVYKSTDCCMNCIGFAA